MCYNKDVAASPARLARGLIGAYNERPHGDSKVPPYSVKARVGVCVQGVVCVLPMAPFYGSRAPPGQHQWYLATVQAGLLQGGTAAWEAACLMHWVEATWRKPIAVAGLSYGGSVAALAACMFPRAVAVAPVFACPSPGHVFAVSALPARPADIRCDCVLAWRCTLSTSLRGRLTGSESTVAHTADASPSWPSRSRCRASAVAHSTPHTPHPADASSLLCRCPAPFSRLAAASAGAGRAGQTSQRCRSANNGG